MITSTSSKTICVAAPSLVYAYKKIMRPLKLCILAAILAAAPIAEAKGQKLTRQQRRARIDSMLTARYYNSSYDTNYVARPEGRLTLKVRMNQTGNSFHAKGTLNGVSSKADLSTSHKTTFSVAAIYRGLGLGVAINPAKWKGAYKDYEFNLNYYSSRISLDFSYQRSESLAGDLWFDDRLEHLESGDVTLKIVNLAGYYAFNHRHFSFPAAFTQSYIQRRSAGSFLAGISYQGGSIDTNDELRARKPDALDARIEVGHLGIGGGYGYNLVLGRKWLLHLSLLPTLVVYNRNKMTVRSGEERLLGKDGKQNQSRHMRFNMIFNERAAIVHNFTSRYFASITFVMNNSVFDDDIVVVNQNKWRARASFGMRL